MQGRAAVAILSGAIQGKEGRLFAWRSQAVASPHALVGHAEWKTRNTLAFTSAPTSSQLVWGFGGRCSVGMGAAAVVPLGGLEPSRGRCSAPMGTGDIQDNSYTGQMPSLPSTSPLLVVVQYRDRTETVLEARDAGRDGGRCSAGRSSAHSMAYAPSESWPQGRARRGRDGAWQYWPPVQTCSAERASRRARQAEVERRLHSSGSIGPSGEAVARPASAAGAMPHTLCFCCQLPRRHAGTLRFPPHAVHVLVLYLHKTRARHADAGRGGRRSRVAWACLDGRRPSPRRPPWANTAGGGSNLRGKRASRASSRPLAAGVGWGCRRVEGRGRCIPSRHPAARGPQQEPNQSRLQRLHAMRGSAAGHGRTRVHAVQYTHSTPYSMAMAIGLDKADAVSQA